MDENSDTDDKRRAAFIWPCLNYTDAPAAMRFLVDVLGFAEAALYSGDSPDVVVHAEARWPEGGGVMFGSAGRADSEFAMKSVGDASVYVITDDPDAVYARAVAAGAEIARTWRRPTTAPAASRSVIRRATCSASGPTAASDRSP